MSGLNPAYMQFVYSEIPKVNPLIANGLAMEHSKHSVEVIDQLFREFGKGFPEGLTYARTALATPEEEYQIETKNKSSSRRYDLARTDAFFIKYTLNLRGVEISRYLALPIVSKANVVHINDTPYIVSPVLADRVISVTASNIFIRLTRAKLTFQKMSTYFCENGERVNIQTIFSELYNHRDKTQFSDSRVKMKTILAHYCFCRYGVTETFQKYAGCTPVVRLREEVNYDDFPTDEWVCCSTASVTRPTTLKTTEYTPSSVLIFIKNEEYTQMVKNLVAGFFYVADHFTGTTRINKDTVNEPLTWQVMLGEALWASDIGVSRLIDEVKRHMDSLDEYVDGLVKLNLRRTDIKVDNLFDLFAIIIDKFLMWHLERAEDANNLYGKELVVLDYLLEDIKKQIATFYFRVKEVTKNGKEITQKELEDLLNKEIKQRAIYALRTPEHGEAFIAESAGDNMIFKITQVVTQQEKTNVGVSKRSEAVSSNDPSLKSHVSVAEICTYSAVSKSDPTGRNRINCYLLLGDDMVTSETSIRGRHIVRNPRLIDIVDRTDTKIKARP